MTSISGALRKWNSTLKPETKAGKNDSLSEIALTKSDSSSSMNSQLSRKTSATEEEEIQYLSRLIHYGDEDALARLQALRNQK